MEGVHVALQEMHIEVAHTVQAVKAVVAVVRTAELRTDLTEAWYIAVD